MNEWQRRLQAAIAISAISSDERGGKTVSLTVIDGTWMQTIIVRYSKQERAVMASAPLVPKTEDE